MTRQQRNQHRHVVANLIVAMMVLSTFVASPVLAQVDLYFSPDDLDIEIGQAARLSIMLDQTLDLRTIEVRIEYDPEVIVSLAGEPGALFTDSDFFLFEGFENDIPGMWHGYVVIMGADDWATGPGELYAWDFEGLAVGVSNIQAVDVALYSPAGGLLGGVTLSDASIEVGDGISGVPDFNLPGERLLAYPNPFNPQVTISYTLPSPGRVDLSVFTIDGRLVRQLESGIHAAGIHTSAWNGRNATGIDMASGIYLLRLESEAAAWRRSITLVR